MTNEEYIQWMHSVKMLKGNPEELKNRVEAWKANLRLDNDEAKPLAGTDVTGRGTHQYVRLAIASLKRGAPRAFILFAESNFLRENLHDMAGTPAWIREGFDDQWMFIEEVTRRPRATDTLDDYTKSIPPKEQSLWMALFEFFIEQGIIEKSVRKYKAKTYGLPKDDSNE